MTLITSDEIQAALITDMKSQSAITALVDADQIREAQIQATEFVYPGIRVRVGTNTPQDDLCPQDVIINVYCFSEQASSKQVMQIAGIIQTTYHHKAFGASGLDQSLRFGNMDVTALGAIRQDRTTWRNELIIRTRVSSG